MTHEFLYSTKVTGVYDLHDHCSEWLFNQFGYSHGECNLDSFEWFVFGDHYGDPSIDVPFMKYNKCADVQYFDVVEYIISLKKMGLKEDTINLVECEMPAMEQGWRNLCKHSHVGVWKSGGFKKTGYDHGIQTYLFKNKEDLATFLLWKGKNK